jgi:hypothetical protein
LFCLIGGNKAPPVKTASLNSSEPVNPFYWPFATLGFRTEGPQILGAAVQNLVATATWRPVFVHPCVAAAYRSGGVYVGTSRIIFEENKFGSSFPYFLFLLKLTFFHISLLIFLSHDL